MKTKQVILLETGDPGKHVWIMKDFVFNRRLDDSLFSCELPEGYTQIPRAPVFMVPRKQKQEK
ncbi:MAG: hypothetical protein ACYS8Z_25760 [Planctomycetota bacterium]